jgi:hypothetical protein
VSKAEAKSARKSRYICSILGIGQILIGVPKRSMAALFILPDIIAEGIGPQYTRRKFVIHLLILMPNLEGMRQSAMDGFRVQKIEEMILDGDYVKRCNIRILIIEIMRKVLFAEKDIIKGERFCEKEFNTQITKNITKLCVFHSILHNPH